MISNIVAWFNSKGGFSHVAAAVFSMAMLAYGAVPQFHALVNQIHAALPGWVQELATTAAALYAWYRISSSPAGVLAKARTITNSPDAPTASAVDAATTK